MRHVPAMSADHVSKVRTDRHVVRCSSRSDGSDEWVTIEYAVSRLLGYWNDEPEGWIEETLRAGTPLQTVSYVYVVDKQEV